MFGSEIVEIGIGLAFTFFLISSICNGVVEIIAELTKARSKNLVQGLKYLLGDPDGKLLVKSIYQHHKIDTGMSSEAGLPTYIAAENFGEALLDSLVPDDGQSFQDRVEALKVKITQDIPNPRVREAILKAISKGEGDVEKVIKNLGDWFNSSMWDLSKIYKKWTKKIVIVTSVLVVIGLNADSVRIVKTLYTDSDVRNAVTAATTAYVEKYSPPPVNNSDTLNTQVLKQQVSALTKNVNDVKMLPVGWWSEKLNPQQFSWLLMKILGLALTIGAVSLGSGFWYDFITKFLSFNNKKGS